MKIKSSIVLIREFNLILKKCNYLIENIKFINF